MTTDFIHGLKSWLVSLPFVQNKCAAGPLLVNVFFLLSLYVCAQPTTLVSAPFASTPASPLMAQPAALNQPPNASFTFSPTRPVKHYPLTLDATASIDADGTIVRYDWNLGDGNTNSTANPIITYTYASTATVTVTLTVTDDIGGTSSFSQTVVIGSSNSFPVASLTVSPSAPFVGDTLTFNGTGSRDPDIDGRVASYLWLFGDGTYSTTANMTLHSYTSSGPYQVMMIVTDNSGATSSASQGVYVLPGLSLTVSSDETQGTAPLSVSLQAQASGGQGPYNFSWAFGDGETAVGQTSVHNYAQPGTYQTQVEVTDAARHTTVSSLTITVTGGAPTTGGQLDFGVDPVLYALNGIGISALGLTVLLLVYAFTVRRGRRKADPDEGEMERANMRLPRSRRSRDS